MTSIPVIQNCEKSLLCLERAWNLQQDGICKIEQQVADQETQEPRPRN